METDDKKPFGCGTVWGAAAIWLVIGGLWAAGLFAVSEAFNQLAIRASDDATSGKLQDISDFFAYPASHWYEARQNTLDRIALERVLAREDLPEEKREEGERLLASLDDAALETDDEAGFDAYDFLTEFGESGEVPTLEEYAIYGGACAMWGAGVGLVGFLATVLILAVGRGEKTPLRQ